MRTHELKTWVRPFEAVEQAVKPYEVRRDDRGYEVGDLLILKEFDACAECDGTGMLRNGDAPATCCPAPHGVFTGRSVQRVVTYKTSGGEWGLPEGLCVLGMREVRR